MAIESTTMNAQQMFDKLSFVPFNELQHIDVTKLPLADQVKAFAESSEYVRFLAHDVINPILEGAMATGSTDREKAIVGCYYRIYAWIATLAMLRDAIHFQAVAAGARSLFEIWVDLKLLTSDKTGTSIERYHAYPRVERFRAAKKFVAFSNKHLSHNIDCSQQRALVSDPAREKQMDALVLKLWGRNKKGRPNYPDHWSGKTLADRISSNDTEAQQIYNERYPLLSWYVHSGSAGYAGLNEDALRSCFGLSHMIAQRASLASIELIAREMKIAQAVEWLQDAIKKTDLVPGMLLVQGKLQEINEAAR